MPGLTPNFAEFVELVNPTGNNYVVGYNVSGGYYTRSPVSGLQNLTGVTYSMFTPLLNQPPIVNYATLESRNTVALLGFGDSTSQSGIFVGSLPFSARVAPGLTVDIKWIAATGVGNCIWGAQVMPLNASINLNTDNFGLAVTGFTVAPTTGLTATTSLFVTGLQGISPGESYRLNVFRLPADTNDTLVGLAQVHTVIVRGA